MAVSRMPPVRRILNHQLGKAADRLIWSASGRREISRWVRACLSRTSGIDPFAAVHEYHGELVSFELGVEFAGQVDGMAWI